MRTSTSLTAAAAVGGILLLSACTTMPSGPNVMVLPGTGKSFEQFRYDDVSCRDYAQYQVGGTNANQSATNAGVQSAVVGTAVGALAGAAIGGHNGAGAGAGAGLIVGSAAGSGAAESTAWGLQRRYDAAYVQCMYAKGHRVPVSAGFTESRQAAPAATTPPPPPSSSYPPPPPR